MKITWDFVHRLPTVQRRALAAVLQTCPDGWTVALVGGAVRDTLLGCIPRDLDLVIEGAASCRLCADDDDAFDDVCPGCDSFERWARELGSDRNHFCGWRINVNDVQVDVWRIEDNAIGATVAPGRTSIVEWVATGATFDCDAAALIVRRCDNGIVVSSRVESPAWEAIARRELELLQIDGSPTLLTVVRASELARRHDFVFGPRLRAYLADPAHTRWSSRHDCAVTVSHRRIHAQNRQLERFLRTRGATLDDHTRASGCSGSASSTTCAAP